VTVGEYAVALHVHPRFTKDIDIFFESSLEGVLQLRKALIAQGFSAPYLPREGFAKEKCPSEQAGEARAGGKGDVEKLTQ